MNSSHALYDRSKYDIGKNVTRIEEKINIETRQGSANI